MKLTHRIRTQQTCIEYYEARDRKTKVQQLKEELEIIFNNHLENDTKTNGLYLGQSKTE